MKFFFDEYGNFQRPQAGAHGVGIVSGIAVPDADEAEIFQRFDAFVSKLPSSSLKDGEPKGKCLDDASRKALATMLSDLPGILLRPIMLDLTSLAGQPHAQVASLSPENSWSRKQRAGNRRFGIRLLNSRLMLPG